MAPSNGAITVENSSESQVRACSHAAGFHTFLILHVYFDPPEISILILRNLGPTPACSMHRGVNAKPFVTSAGDALMYVTTTAACFPFPPPREGPHISQPPPPASPVPRLPPAPRRLERPDYHVHEQSRTQAANAQQLSRYWRYDFSFFTLRAAYSPEANGPSVLDQEGKVAALGECNAGKQPKDNHTNSRVEEE